MWTAREILALDLHAKLLSSGPELRLLGPLMFRMEAGERLAIETERSGDSSRLLDILTTRDCNWLGALRLQGNGVSGQIDRRLSSLGIGILGHQLDGLPGTVEDLFRVPSEQTAESKDLLRGWGINDRSAQPIDRLHGVSRDRVELVRTVVAPPQLLIIEGGRPWREDLHPLLNRMLHALYRSGTSILFLMPPHPAPTLQFNAPRIVLPSCDLAPLERTDSPRLGRSRIGGGSPLAAGAFT